MRCFGLLGGFGNLRGFLAAGVGGGWRPVAHFSGGGHGGDRRDSERGDGSGELAKGELR